jgi:hypothetical protein
MMHHPSNQSDGRPSARHYPAKLGQHVAMPDPRTQHQKQKCFDREHRSTSEQMNKRKTREIQR